MFSEEIVSQVVREYSSRFVFPMEGTPDHETVYFFTLETLIDAT